MSTMAYKIELLNGKIEKDSPFVLNIRFHKSEMCPTCSASLRDGFIVQCLQMISGCIKI